LLIVFFTLRILFESYTRQGRKRRRSIKKGSPNGQPDF